MTSLTTLTDSLGEARPIAGGHITTVRGLVVEGKGLDLPIGAMAEIEVATGFLPAEVIGVRGEHIQLMPLESTRGIGSGCRVWPVAQSATVPVGDSLLGRVVDAMGKPLDNGPPIVADARAEIYPAPIPPLERPVLSEPLDVGVRSINATATFARGQRVGLFAGAGVGKSTLLGMMARGTDADVTVMALIGERGREVREFIERVIGSLRTRTVVVAVTSEASPALRVRGAFLATAISEYFRDRGKNVLLFMDSVTRFAMAAREIGLARGEPATTKGYTPSVFAALPALLERAGRNEQGSITGVYSVLVEGDDLEDPIADSLRAILDGHVVLSRDLAEQGLFPAVDVLASMSRSMPSVADEEHTELAVKLRRLLAGYRDAEDLIQVGAYAKGSDPVVDEAIARRPAIQAFLAQRIDEVVPLGASVDGIRSVLSEELQ